jgi:hypothetical protein
MSSTYTTPTGATGRINPTRVMAMITQAHQRHLDHMEIRWAVALGLISEPARCGNTEPAKISPCGEQKQAN